MEPSRPDAFFGAKTLGRTLTTRKLSSTAQILTGTGVKVGSGLKTAENPENAISGAAAPEADNVTEFIEGFREKDASDFTELPNPNNMGLKEGKQYGMVVGRHPNERKVQARQTEEGG